MADVKQKTDPQISDNSNSTDPTNATECRRPCRPTERQCALLILRLIQAREKEFEEKRPKRKVSRAQISQNTIRRLCGRSQISNDFLLEVQEHLLAAGWALFCIGPSYFAIVKLESVQAEVGSRASGSLTS